ncbi:hypothetical protein 010DV004_26 [Bacillus phage 010DV004]|nr:hypothetical protein 010DV004_26 [Bacillus phage 010DV004]QZA69243.1 hypothetical protein 010DV005_26 [Bacillus phage 010DV005]
MNALQAAYQLKNLTALIEALRVSVDHLNKQAKDYDYRELYTHTEHISKHIEELIAQETALRNKLTALKLD